MLSSEGDRNVRCVATHRRQRNAGIEVHVNAGVAYDGNPFPPLQVHASLTFMLDRDRTSLRLQKLRALS